MSECCICRCNVAQTRWSLMLSIHIFDLLSSRNLAMAGQTGFRAFVDSIDV